VIPSASAGGPELPVGYTRGRPVPDIRFARAARPVSLGRTGEAGYRSVDSAPMLTAWLPHLPPVVGAVPSSAPVPAEAQ
jgi:hypothetical protein